MQSSYIVVHLFQSGVNDIDQNCSCIGKKMNPPRRNNMSLWKGISVLELRCEEFVTGEKVKANQLLLWIS